MDATTVNTSFDGIMLADLAALPSEVMDALSFGVIGLDRDGIAVVYNETEARLAGLAPTRVLGAPFFENIAQCMNNFLVAQRFEDVEELDETVPFVLTLRMRPTPVRLRLLQSSSQLYRFVLIER